MTRIWTFSDLHQEWASNAYDPTAHAPASFDVVVVAGDVHTPGTSAVDWLADRFGGVPIVYVLGNHDLYCDADDPYTYDDMYARTRDRGASRGVTVLVDDTAVVAGVRFVGGTLWTDMRVGSHSIGHGWNTARRGMNDYRRIRRRQTGRHHHMRPEDTCAMFRQTRAAIMAQTAVTFDGPTVVLTHHAPSPRSLDDPHMDLRWCYASDLEDLMDRPSGPALWIHGHLHSHSDYRLGNTRVVANPRGHIEEAATSGFVPNLVIDLPTGTPRSDVTDPRSFVDSAADS